MVALSALFVALCATALAVFAIYSLKKQIQRISALETRVMPPDAARFVAPMYDSAPVEVPFGLDDVGAWALEQARRGIEVSDEEMAVQRRMWAEEMN